MPHALFPNRISARSHSSRDGRVRLLAGARQCRLTAGLIVFCSIMALAGCGNKGPLYLPPEAPITEVGPGEPGEQPEQEGQDEQGDTPDSQP